MSDDRIIKLGYDVDQIKESVSLIDTKLDKVEEKLVSNTIELKEHLAREAVSDRMMLDEIIKMNSLLKENNEDWREHMQRTKMNEVSAEELKKISLNLDIRLQRLEKREEESLAIKKFTVKSLKVVGTILGVISGTIGLYVAITNLF
jgi:hypothetical protein